MNKKALTPIMSTILLLVFAITLGIMVMSWGKSGMAIDVPGTCSLTNIQILHLEGKPELCYEGNIIFYSLGNTGSKDISGFKATIITDDIENIAVKRYIKSGDFIKDKFQYNGGAIKKINFIPRLDNIYCGENIIESENIRRC